MTSWTTRTFLLKLSDFATRMGKKETLKMLKGKKMTMLFDETEKYKSGPSIDFAEIQKSWNKKFPPRKITKGLQNMVAGHLKKAVKMIEESEERALGQLAKKVFSEIGVMYKDKIKMIHRHGENSLLMYEDGNYKREIEIIAEIPLEYNGKPAGALHK